jgi:hypothetical protein
VGGEEVGKEEHFEHNEDDEELDEDDEPQGFAQSHVLESIVVEVPCPAPEAFSSCLCFSLILLQLHIQRKDKQTFLNYKAFSKKNLNEKNEISEYTPKNNFFSQTGLNFENNNYLCN